MSKPKKQHYVPQFLLRNFATGKKQKARLWVLDKRTCSVFPSSVRDVAHENLFYEHHGDQGSIALEGLMDKLDTKGAQIVSDVLEKKRLPTVGEERIWLSYFLAAQMLRTPSTRNDMENFRQIIIHKFGEDIQFEGDSKTVGEYGPEDAKITSLRLIRKSVPEFAKLLQEKEWCLCEAPHTHAYVMADSPVTRYNGIYRGPRGNLGLKNEGIELHMPFSARLAIHLVCPRLAAVTRLLPDFQKDYPRAFSEGVPVMMARENVDFINSQQVAWAERFVYAKEREHLALAVDMLRTNPELKDGPGSRQRPEEV